MKLQSRQKRLLAIGISMAIVIGSHHAINLFEPAPRIARMSVAPEHPASLPATVAQPASAEGVSAAPHPVRPVATLSDDRSSVLPEPPPEARDPADFTQRSVGGMARWRPEPGLDLPVLHVAGDHYGPFGLPCGPHLSAVTIANGDLNLSVAAPCRLHSRLNVKFGPVEFTAMTDHVGAWSATLPPLSEGGLTIAFEDGAVLTHHVVARADDMQSVAALVSPADAGMRLVLHDPGTDEGGASHLEAGTPPVGLGRFYLLGAPELAGGRVTQVYAAPVGAPPARLSVEVEVTPANCGRDVAGFAALAAPDGTLRPHPISFAVPGCDALGEYLVLKNLAPSRTLALR
ncbi:hypothetical protein EV663_10610 [Rhodovulum bhavnagarense]|uniref:Uncharacterized protein n=1 Tax=Rhodovulum bhavnagarense TaxID=992286 RepID=A0A4R2RER7_9RHOB|nr:hypothetical protein [Rhodovulum bhavnagarense]TCP61064.1 hypothetical protein EV663_10610 [Rhodovulum bhavnagarense]